MKISQRLWNMFSGSCLSKKSKNSACVAKERLQIIVSHEGTKKNGAHGTDIINQLQKELLEVISKYVKVDQELIKVQLERNGDQSVLELNVTLPENNALLTN